MTGKMYQSFKCATVRAYSTKINPKVLFHQLGIDRLIKSSIKLPPEMYSKEAKIFLNGVRYILKLHI